MSWFLLRRAQQWQLNLGHAPQDGAGVVINLPSSASTLNPITDNPTESRRNIELQFSIDSIPAPSLVFTLYFLCTLIEMLISKAVEKLWRRLNSMLLAALEESFI
jgi:hypothetical protein